MTMNDDDDIFDDVTPTEGELPYQELEEDDLLQDILTARGISDPSKIKFEDESGAIVERDWNDLSRNELLNMIVGEQEETQKEDDDLSDDEIDLLNLIRMSGKDVKGYMDALIPKQEPIYRVDGMSDDDIFILDLIDTVGPNKIDNAEITNQLEVAKQNPDLFKKRVDGLRENYLRLEKDQQEAEAARVQQENTERYNNYANAIYQEIGGLHSFAGQELELEDQDRNELASYLLDLDQNGFSQFGKDLNDPKTFTELAFWALNKNSIIQELNALILNSYKRGYAAAKADLSKSRLVIPERNDYLLEDDDSWLFDNN